MFDPGHFSLRVGYAEGRTAQARLRYPLLWKLALILPKGMTWIPGMGSSLRRSIKWELVMLLLC